jgi:hypothetical protein
METRGVGRPTNGSRQHASGRRLRTAVVGAIAVGGAIFMGGAASMVTAFANTGAVSGSENCTTWSVTAHLDNNVTNRWVTVTWPDSTTFVIQAEYTTTSSGAADIFTASGSPPKTGTITEIIYNGATASTGVAETYPLSIAPADDCTTTPTIATTPSGTAAVGKAIHDVATVTGSGASPTGTVIFKLYGPDNTTCNVDGSAAVFTSSAITLVPSTAGVSTATSPDFTPTAPGTYHWIARYSGDGGVHYNPVSSVCEDEAVLVSKAAPTIATSQSAGGNIGVVLSDTATVSGGSSPTGTVTFVLFPPSNATCSANGTAAVYTSPAEALSGGKATSGSYTTTSAAGAGTYLWVATYSGDANNSGAASGCTAEAVTVSGGGGTLGITTGGVAAVTTPSTGDAAVLTGMTIGGFLLLSGLGFVLVSMMLPRRRIS